MPFTFTDIEGLDPDTITALNANAAVLAAIDAHTTSAIEPAVTARVQVSKDEFKKKMDAMDTKMRAAIDTAATGGIDPDELKALKEARDKNPELVATLDALKKKGEQNDKDLQAAQEKMQGMRMNQNVSSAINEYNTANPTRKIKDDAHDLVALLARDALKYDADADTFRVHNKHGDIMATDQGAATTVDWLVSTRNERPSLYDVPVGGGAPGSNKNGSAEKVISRAEFAKLAPQAQADTARSHQITE